jgi:hypothetical protein
MQAACPNLTGAPTGRDDRLLLEYSPAVVDMGASISMDAFEEFIDVSTSSA